MCVKQTTQGVQTAELDMIKALRLKFLEEAVWRIMLWLPPVWPAHETAFPTWSVLSKVSLIAGMAAS